jgi:WD40 repeat protein/serine/threonine protein kinase
VPAASDTLGSLPAEGRVDKLGRFLIQRKLGQGSFGTVYLAFDPVLDREVAIKVPRHGAQLSQQEQERFLREAKAAGKLRHPNIVPVYDAGNDDGQLFIASAFIEGQTLEKRLEQGRPEFAEVARLMIALAEALDYAHGQDTVHRDVKPANIMLDAKGEPMLMDFGLAQLREAEDRLTHDGTVLGTPAYMAPEQAAARADEVGAASDQYSLGVVLYELLCGERPFEGPPALVISMVINQEPPSPKSHNSAISRDLETICLKAMAKSTQHRFGSCQHLADDLGRWLNDEPIHARRVSVPERFVRWCKRNQVVSSLVLATLVTLMLGMIFTTYFAIQARNKAEAIQRAADAETKELLERQRADDAAKSEKQLAYRNHIQHAYEAWNNSISNVALDSLNHFGPGTGLEELRGFEWYYLRRLCVDKDTLCISDSNVRRAMFSPDGKQMATAGSNVILWDLAAGKHRVLATKSPVNDVSFSQDGTRLAAALEWGGAMLWDPSDGKHLNTLRSRNATEELPDGICRKCVAFSPDGTRLAVGGQFGLTIFDVRTGQTVATTKDYTDSMVSVAFSPDGMSVASSAGDNGRIRNADRSVKIWDAKTGREIRAMAGHTSDVTRVAFSSDGKRLASASVDNITRIWDTSTGEESLIIRGRDTTDAGLWSWHASTNQESWTPVRRYGIQSDSRTNPRVGDVAFSPDGVRIASISGAMVFVCNASTGKLEFTREPHDGAVLCLAFSPDGKRLVSGGSDRKVKLWDATSVDDPSRLIGHKSSIQCVAFSLDGTRLASASGDKTVRIWDLKTGKQLVAIQANVSFVESIAFSPDGTRLASGTADKTVKVWDAQTGQEIWSLAGHTGSVRSVAFNHDGTRFASSAGHGVASAGPDYTVRIWDMRSGNEVFTLSTNNSTPLTGRAVTFSPDGKRVASIADDGTVVVWDTNSRKQVMRLPENLSGRQTPPDRIAFSRDSLRLSAVGDSTLRTWDLATGKQLVESRPVFYSFDASSISPDGQRLAIARTDGQYGSISILDAATSHELLTLGGHSANAAIRCLAFSPDGFRLASGSLDGTVKIWDASPMD